VRLNKIRSKDADLNRTQDNVDVVLNFIQQSPLTGPVSVVTADLAVGDNVVGHRLNRVPIGYIIVSQTAATTTYTYAQQTSTFFYINSSAIATATILFF